MAHLSEFERSYVHVLLYPPQPAAVLDVEGRKGNFSQRMYGFYLREMQTQITAGIPVSETFLVWACPGSGEGVVPTNKAAAMRLHKHCAWVNHCLSMWRQGQPMPDADDGAL